MPKLFKVASCPSKQLDKQVLLEHIGRNPFGIIYSFSDATTNILLGSGNPYELRLGIESAISGLEFEESEAEVNPSYKTAFFTFYKSIEVFRASLLSDIFSTGIYEGMLGLVFIPVYGQELEKGKKAIERILENSPSRVSFSSKTLLGNSKGDSYSEQHEVFSSSEETIMLKEALDEINRSVISNGMAYKISIFYNVPEPSEARLEQYLDSKFLLFKKEQAKVSAVGETFEISKRLASIPFGAIMASELIGFYGNVGISYVISSRAICNSEGIMLGTPSYSFGGNQGKVRIDKKFFNLGFIVSGLPGSGKTSEAMGIISQLNSDETIPKTKIVVLAPTNEWSEFGYANKMNVVRLCNDRTPINFFKPPKGVDRGHFYQDLAMLIASASESGPYQKPLEKCLLNAFRRYYGTHDETDPTKLFNEIEESIIELHGKRTNVGVKYTKHGENIKSSLEGLIEILQFKEYSGTEGLDIEKAIDQGLVFDVSAISVQMKVFFYALILNQIYALASKFALDGDDKLRLLICVEEAQMLFKDPKSATVIDLKSRIQDFRKLGVGLMLLVHSVTDIDSGIRRLCQLKLYLKQSPDVAETAAEDLIFYNVEDDDVIAKLKHLESGTGALNYIIERNGIKTNPDTVFVKTIPHQNLIAPAVYPSASSAEETEKSPNTWIIIVPVSKKLPEYCRIRFLGAFMLELTVDPENPKVEANLVKDREYAIEFLNDKRKVISSGKFIGGYASRMEV